MLEVKIHTMDSPEALPYLFRSSTHVLLDKEAVPIDIATDKEKMNAFLSSKL